MRFTMATNVTSGPRVLVLVLPGGTNSSYRPFSRWQTSALRMYPFTWSIRARYGSKVRVRQARYRVVGWNGGQASPLPYARAALDDLTRSYPGVPVVVIGHSMGGRVAAHLAADTRVVGVLALAPWWQYADWRLIHDAVRVVAIHGTADTRTFARRTKKGIAELTDRGIDATFVSVPGGGHSMLDHIWLWHRAALDFVQATLDDPPAHYAVPATSARSSGRNG